MPVIVSGGSTGKALKTLKVGNMHADGSEQLLLEFIDIGKVSGYVDLSEMGLGDKAEIRQYLLVNGVYQKYADEAYSDAQSLPIVYITPKETDKGLKVTLQQTAGFMRSYDNRFILEE